MPLPDTMIAAAELSFLPRYYETRQHRAGSVTSEMVSNWIELEDITPDVSLDVVVNHLGRNLLTGADLVCTARNPVLVESLAMDPHVVMMCTVTKRTKKVFHRRHARFLVVRNMGYVLELYDSETEVNRSTVQCRYYVPDDAFVSAEQGSRVSVSGLCKVRAAHGFDINDHGHAKKEIDVIFETDELATTFRRILKKRCLYSIFRLVVLSSLLPVDVAHPASHSSIAWKRHTLENSTLSIALPCVFVSETYDAMETTLPVLPALAHSAGQQPSGALHASATHVHLHAPHSSRLRHSAVERKNSRSSAAKIYHRLIANSFVPVSKAWSFDPRDSGSRQHHDASHDLVSIVFRSEPVERSHIVRNSDQYAIDLVEQSRSSMSVDGFLHVNNFESVCCISETHEPAAMSVYKYRRHNMHVVCILLAHRSQGTSSEYINGPREGKGLSLLASVCHPHLDTAVLLSWSLTPLLFKIAETIHL
eukprot:ANDGO_00406.mRNA.1 hypothetical protein